MLNIQHIKLKTHGDLTPKHQDNLKITWKVDQIGLPKMWVQFINAYSLDY